MKSFRQSELKRESVWDYPRPPRLETTQISLRAFFGDLIVAESHSAYRVLETSHPPTYYFNPDDVRRDLLARSQAHSFCEFKGHAQYWDIVVGSLRAEQAAWSYPHPSCPFEPLKNFLSFYASKVDACFVGEEQVNAQPGDFYGGWITSNLVGPFKGGPGSLGW